MGLNKYISAEKLTILIFVLGAYVFFSFMIKAISGYDNFENEKQVLKQKNVSSKLEKKQKKTLDNHLTIVGPSGSGKTSLFYQIYTGEARNTVSSIDENISGIEQVKIDEVTTRSL
jgi:ABC-type lipoprotein export system ATPase subunit